MHSRSVRFKTLSGELPFVNMDWKTCMLFKDPYWCVELFYVRGKVLMPAYFKHNSNSVYSS